MRAMYDAVVAEDVEGCMAALRRVAKAPKTADKFQETRARVRGEMKPEGPGQSIYVTINGTPLDPSKLR